MNQLYYYQNTRLLKAINHKCTYTSQKHLFTYIIHSKNVLKNHKYASFNKNGKQKAQREQWQRRKHLQVLIDYLLFCFLPSLSYIFTDTHSHFTTWKINCLPKNNIIFIFLWVDNFLVKMQIFFFFYFIQFYNDYYHQCFCLYKAKIKKRAA